MSFNGVDSQSFSNISADTAAFKLRGGRYAFEVTGSNYGSVSLQRQAVDGTTYIDVATAFTADGYATVDLPAGSYRVHVSSATGVYADITSVAVTQ